MNIADRLTSTIFDIRTEVRVEPEAIYLGHNEYRELLKVVEQYGTHRHPRTWSDDRPTFNGIRVYVVRDANYLRVV